MSHSASAGQGIPWAVDAATAAIVRMERSARAASATAQMLRPLAIQQDLCVVGHTVLTIALQ